MSHTYVAIVKSGTLSYHNSTSVEDLIEEMIDERENPFDYDFYVVSSDDKMKLTLQKDSDSE